MKDKKRITCLVLCLVLQYALAWLIKADTSRFIRDNWMYFFPLGFHLCCLAVLAFCISINLKVYRDKNNDLCVGFNSIEKDGE